MAANNLDGVEVDSGHMYAGNMNAYVVIKSFNTTKLSCAVMALNLTQFFDSQYCRPLVSDTLTQAASGYTYLHWPVRFLLLTCNQLDQEPINDLILALVGQLSHLAIRAADIVAISVSCNDDGSSWLDLRFTAATGFANNVTTALGQLSVWNEVYFDLIDKSPSTFASVLEVVEFDTDRFAPSYLQDDYGSGDLP